jgi:hypothetical protein
LIPAIDDNNSACHSAFIDGCFTVELAINHPTLASITSGISGSLELVIPAIGSGTSISSRQDRPRWPETFGSVPGWNDAGK